MNSYRSTTVFPIYTESNTTSLLGNTSNNQNDACVDGNRYRIIFIVCEVVWTIIVVISLWILASMIQYGRLKGKWKTNSRRGEMNGRIVFTSAVVALAFTFPRYLMDQVLFNAALIENNIVWCEVIMDISNSTYFVAMYPIYLFLWFRQRTFYSHPAMSRLTGKVVRGISWLTFAALSIGAIGVGSLFVFPEEYTSVSGQCVLIEVSNLNEEQQIIFFGSYYILFAFLVVAQFSLLGLFLYPMKRSNAIGKQSRRQSSNTTIMTSTNENSETEAPKPRRRPTRIHCCINIIRDAGKRFSEKGSSRKKIGSVERAIRRSVVCSIFSVASDLIAFAVVTLAVPNCVPRVLTNAIYDLAMFVSVLCILATFETYRDILTVFWHRGEGTERFFNSAGSSKDTTPKTKITTPV